MRKIAGMVLVLTLGMSAPAYAGDRHGYRDDRDCQSGNCGNESEDQYGQCKYVCPAFDKSPVQDSFNIQVCVQPGSCTAEDPKKKEGQK